MKNLFFISLIFIVSVLISCGTGNDSKKTDQKKDTVNDTIAKKTLEIKSYDLLKLAMENEEGFNNRYGSKKLSIKNLVVDNVSKSGMEMQCLAYAPTDSLLSHTSQKGDRAKNVAEYRDYVNDIPCKINPDFTYYFDITCTEIIKTASIKEMKTKEEKLMKKSYFYTVITVEGESITFNENTFTLKNCKIINAE